MTTHNITLIQKQPDELINLARQLLTEQVLAYLPDHWQAYQNDEQTQRWLTDQLADLFEINHNLEACGLMIVHRQNDTWYLGFMLLPSYWGKGIAVKAVQQLQAIAKRQGVGHIVAGAHVDNAASVKVLTKCGFQLTTESQQITATWQSNNH